VEKLIKHLIASGISAEQAATIAATFGQGEAADEDALTKAMNGLRDAFEREHAEKVEEAFRKSLSDAEGSRDAIARAGDLMLAEVQEQNAALAQGLVENLKATRDLVKSFTDGFDAMQNQVAALEDELRAVRAQVEGEDGSIAQIRKSLGQPVPGRAMTLDLETLPTPGERSAGGVSIEQEITSLRDQALTEVKDPGTPPSRRDVISKAMAGLDSGVPLDLIRKSLGYSKN
jgi:prophage DNA circulation protein